jgi:hypothetical protein
MSSNDPMYVNTPTYSLSVTSSSGQITLTDKDTNAVNQNLIFTNEGSAACFVVTSATNPATAAFPASATVPVDGTVILPGATCTFKRDDKHKYIAAITRTGTTTLTVKLGTGE